MQRTSQLSQGLVCLILVLHAFSLGAAEEAQDPATAMRLFRVAPGLKVDLFAAEPMVQNVVSFTFDEQGRCYVVESHRRRTSAFDITYFPDWLESDFTLRTVEQRADFLKRTLTLTNQAEIDRLSTAKRGFLPDLNGDGVRDWRDLEAESERIRLLVDTNSDGRADIATTFAEGFDGITSGVAAGVLARKGDVWFTCIPDLWRLSTDQLRKTNGMPDFAAPANPHHRNANINIQSLIHGFGTHIAVGGHDLHGLKMGPDGKIYFSIADRGTSTNLWDRIVDHWPGLTMEALADSGAVFRCHPNGTELEVVAIGLRNPQELAFDEFGNLFTGDNNSDHGDKSRWEYIVEGADYGWRIGWQWLPKTGAWNSEMLWGMAPSNTSSYYLPPVTHIAAGPAGTAYYPGTGLPARYDGHFFLCDFRGGPNSLVHSFALRPKGAGFEAYDESEFIGGFLCTDVEFGLDGAVYVSDWVKGWEKTGQGRIWRVFDSNLVNNSAVLEVKQLLGEGMEKRSNEGLARLLGHRDMRVRLEAQWELAHRVQVIIASKKNKRLRYRDDTEIIDELQRLAANSNRDNSRRDAPLIARVHAIQALSEIGRTPATIYDYPFLSNLRSRPNAEELLGWHTVPLLLLQRGEPEAQVAVLRMLEQVAGQPANWATISYFVEPTLTYPAPRVRAQAAQLIGRFRRKEFVPSLISLLRDNKDQDAYIRHAAVFALARIGDVEGLLAAANDSSPAVRMGVCLALRRLQRPDVAQFLNDPDPRIVLEAARAINDVPIPKALPDLARLLSRSSRAPSETSATESFVLRRAINAYFRLGRKENASALASFAADDNAPEALRGEALELLSLWAKPPARDRVVGLWRPLPPRDGEVAARVLDSVLPKIESNAPDVVKVAARKALAALASKPDVVSPLALSSEELAKLSSRLENGTIAEKQSALAVLASANDASTAKLLSAWLDKLLAGQVAKELRLDILDAARRSHDVSTKEKVARYEAARDSHDALAEWRECLYGGNAEDGGKTFLERQDAACLRCHKINGEGGEVGPDLTGIGQRQTRESILESILFPNRNIAPGFESAVVTMKNGSSYAGVVKSENDTQLVIHSPEDGLLTVKKTDIQRRDHGLSAMPEGVAEILSKRDLRNLMEFLATTPAAGRSTDKR